MEPLGSLLHSQQPTICPIPEPDQSIPFLKIHFNISLPYTPRSSKWSLSLKSPHQNAVCNSPVPHMCHMTCPSHSSSFDHPNNIWWGSTDHKAPRYVFFSTTPISLSLLGPNIFFSTLLSNTLKLCSSLKLTNQVIPTQICEPTPMIIPKKKG